MIYKCSIITTIQINSNYLRRRLTERQGEWIWLSLFPASSLPAHSLSPSPTLLCCTHCRNCHQSSFINIVSKTQSCFLLCPSRLFLAPLKYSGILGSLSLTLAVISTQDALPLCIFSYLSEAIHNLALLKSILTQKHSSSDYPFWRICRCFSGLFCSFLSWSHLLLEELFWEEYNLLWRDVQHAHFSF